MDSDETEELCDYCFSDGEYDCDECDGDDEDCSACGGSGTVECDYCQ